MKARCVSVAFGPVAAAGIVSAMASMPSVKSSVLYLNIIARDALTLLYRGYPRIKDRCEARVGVDWPDQDDTEEV